DGHRCIGRVFVVGLSLTIREAAFAADAIADYFAGAGRDEPNPFLAHQRLCEGGMDVIQDLMDAFWDQPLAFAVLAHRQHVEGIIDIFAGRIYMDKPSAALEEMHAINAAARRRGVAAMARFLS